MYTFLLVALAALWILVIMLLNRQLSLAMKSNKLSVRRIGWLFAAAVAACAGLAVVLQVLATLHGLD